MTIVEAQTSNSNKSDSYGQIEAEGYRRLLPRHTLGRIPLHAQGQRASL